MWTGAATVPSNNGPPIQKPIPVAMASSDACRPGNATDYSLLYSDTHNMPLWASFSLTVQESWNLTNETLTEARGCVTEDPRVQTLAPTEWCAIDAEQFTRGYLFEPGMFYFKSELHV